MFDTNTSAVDGGTNFKLACAIELKGIRTVSWLLDPPCYLLAYWWLSWNSQNYAFYTLPLHFLGHNATWSALNNDWFQWASHTCCRTILYVNTSLFNIYDFVSHFNFFCNVNCVNASKVLCDFCIMYYRSKL